jgi:signal transduction histidine kinase
MRLRLQVFAGLVFVLLLTMLGAWILAAGVVFRPLMSELNSERVAVAVHLAEIAERRQAPRKRIQAMSEDLGLEVRMADEISPGKRSQAQVYERHGRSVLVLPGRYAPVAVPLHLATGEQKWLVVAFQADLERPRTRVAFGLLVITAAATILAFLILRFVFRPLEVATTAMQRVASGDLAHRVPTRGAIGEVASTFNKMAVRVQNLVQGQRDLMAAVSHELRTPLTRMRLMLELLPESSDPKARIAALKADVDEVDSLVGELLDSARLHQGMMVLEYTEVAPHELMETALKQVDLGKRNVRVEGRETAAFFGDTRRLLRCLTNLLSNVDRYTPPNCDVILRAEQDGGQTWLSVEDAGPGVSEADRARLFDPFFRAESSRSKATGGLGLGLMLVKQIAEAHGGTVEALDSPQGGLLVRVGIPSEGPGD